MELSIIIPVFNEIGFLEKFANKLTHAFNNQNVEIIFVNDGSNDGSAEWLEKYVAKANILQNEFSYILINLPKNMGKGFAIRKGIEASSGDYLLFQDADLELDPVDSFEMFELIKKNYEMKVIFGSRFLSGKLRSNKNFINELFVKLNSLIFNILFHQSISDLHCGTKIIYKKSLENIKLTINDFGFEIDFATQVAKNNINIYEYGVSYFSRSQLEGKKITWLDGLLSYYYLFKTRFIDNDISIFLSIIYSAFYMAIIGLYFGSGIGKVMITTICLLIGIHIGLYKKLCTSSLVFIFIYLGSIFSKGNGKTYTVLIGFIFGIYFSRIISKKINEITDNRIIRFFV